MKTTVYVYPRLFLLFLCAPALVDLRIRRIETEQYWRTDNPSEKDRNIVVN